VSRLVVLPDYQGIGVGKRLLNFIAELYTSQMKIPFYILTSNPQIMRGNMKNWRITRFGHACRGKENTTMNNAIRSSLSRKRITISIRTAPNHGFMLRRNKTKTRVFCTKDNMSKFVLIVVFLFCRVFSSCGHLLYLSFSEAEAFPDLVLLFHLSSHVNVSLS